MARGVGCVLTRIARRAAGDGVREAGDDGVSAGGGQGGGQEGRQERGAVAQVGPLCVALGLPVVKPWAAARGRGVVTATISRGNFNRRPGNRFKRRVAQGPIVAKIKLFSGCCSKNLLNSARC